MNSVSILRQDLDAVDALIAKIGWHGAEPLLRSYRHWVIQALSFIQLKNFDKS